ncbi:MAG: 5-amino-6-(5-phospho-D-ribitylamino)uracil phosphatase YigB [Candidatus Erwinia impunctatus]
MIIFYRPLKPIAAISFDLDDTLYNNHPVIRHTAHSTHVFLQEYHPALAKVTPEQFQNEKNNVAEKDPEVCHDVSEWRRRAIEQLMYQAGLSADEANKGAMAVMAHFMVCRNQIQVPDETHRVLTALAQKVPLLAITNGNAQPEHFGLGHYFSFMLRAGPDGRAKPDAELFEYAASKTGLPCSSILHVGDDLTTDVAGAVRSGMQSCWFNPHQHSVMRCHDARLLPDLTISRLASLLTLL